MASPYPPIVAIDCEMIGIGMRSYLARVTIVDYSGDVIFDAFVKPPIIRNATLKINYRTSISGVTKELLDRGRTFPRVQANVISILKDKIVIGHGLTNDFKALQIPDWRTRYIYFDTTEIPFFMKTRIHKREGFPDRLQLQPRKLKDLAAEFLGKVIQAEGVPHDSAEDARTVIELYKALPAKFVPASAPAPTGPEPSAPNVGSKERRRKTRKCRHRY